MIACCPPDAPQGVEGDGVVLDSTIRCPHCSMARCERMPVDACRIAYECTGCGATLRPLPGDCCVFCSYGSVPCPPVQLAERRSIGR
ncbi:MAG TPA: GDCCVxC domain-containing (seleno)protein [Xanthobacteraceae bacterium]